MKRVEFEDCKECPYLKRHIDTIECTKTGMMFRIRTLPHYIDILFKPVEQYDNLLKLCPLEEIIYEDY